MTDPVQSIRAIYNAYAPTYVAQVTPIVRYYGRVERFLATHATNACTVLDLGCGPGNLTANLPDSVSVVGLDISDNMLTLARIARPTGNYRVHDLHVSLPLSTRSIDVVLCAGVLDFCLALDHVIGEVARVLRSDGVAFLTFVDRLPRVQTTRPAADLVVARSGLLPPRLRTRHHVQLLGAVEGELRG